MSTFVSGQKVSYVGDYGALSGKEGYVVEDIGKDKGVLVAFEGFTEGHSDSERIPGAKNLWWTAKYNLKLINAVPVKYPPGTKVRLNERSHGMKTTPETDGVIVCRDPEDGLYLCNFRYWGRGYACGRDDGVRDRWWLAPHEFTVVGEVDPPEDVAEPSEDVAEPSEDVAEDIDPLLDEFDFMAEASLNLDAFDPEVATRIVSYLYARYA